jgi:hypothetical protein
MRRPRPPGVNLNSRKLGKVAKDDRADWREARELFPGRGWNGTNDWEIAGGRGLIGTNSLSSDSNSFNTALSGGLAGGQIGSSTIPATRCLPGPLVWRNHLFSFVGCYGLSLCGIS